MKYQVEVRETLSKVVDIEASSEDEAIQLVKEQYQNEEIILDSENYIETEYEIYEDIV